MSVGSLCDAIPELPGRWNPIIVAAPCRATDSLEIKFLETLFQRYGAKKGYHLLMISGS